MLKNYLKITWRSLVKQKLFSFINIIGLAIGFTASFLIVLFVLDEYRANHWVRNLDRQYFIESDWKGGLNRPGMTTLGPLGKTLREEYPHLVANYFSIDALGCNVSNGQDKHFLLSLQIGDSTLLEMFGIPLLHGDASTALDDPNGIVIQKEVAMKFFGRTDVIGQELILGTQNDTYHPLGKKNYKITAVIDDLPENSITDNLGDRNDIYINSSNIHYFRQGDFFETWDNFIVQTRIELVAGVHPGELIAPIQKIIEARAPSHIAEQIIPKLTPLNGYNLSQNNGAKLRMLYLLAAMAAFILMMAMINFVNLSMGMASRRLKEIGLRKAVGGNQRQLMFQFLTESIFFALLAYLLALSITQIMAPYYTTLVEKPMMFSNLALRPMLLVFGIGAFVIGLVAGIYPAVVLSGRQTVAALKGKGMSLKKRGISMKKVLLTVQFVLASFFLVCSFIVSRQVDFFLNKDLGYDGKDILVVSSVPRWFGPAGVDRMLDVRNQLAGIPGLSNASLSWEVPDGRYGNDIELRNPGHAEDLFHSFGRIGCDEYYASTYDLALLEGRFLQDYDRNTWRIVLNETAANVLFGDAPAVGQRVALRGSQEGEVVGVVKDFNFGPLHEPIKGCVFSYMAFDLYRYLSFEAEPGRLQEVTAQLRGKWEEVFPQTPFEHFYMEDKINDLYHSETQFKKAMEMATIFMISIVLIGLFGITVQGIASRTKEIGVRKVLGASSFTIWKVLTRDYLWIYGVAALVAYPLAYFAMDNWLGGFAFRIEQPGEIYFLSLMAFLILTLLTIASEVVKASNVNPVDSLRHE